MEFKIRFFGIWIHYEAFSGLRNLFCGFRKNLIFFRVHIYIFLKIYAYIIMSTSDYAGIDEYISIYKLSLLYLPQWLQFLHCYFIEIFRILAEDIV